jgi:hypothetical protein
LWKKLVHLRANVPGHAPRMKDNADFIDISFDVSMIRKMVLWTRNEWSLNREDDIEC